MLTGGVMVFFGGFINGVGVTNELWEYDGVSWSLREPEAPQGTPAPRYNAGWAYDTKRNVMVLYGGALGQDMNSVCPKPQTTLYGSMMVLLGYQEILCL